jgi:hypothetical protein
MLAQFGFGAVPVVSRRPMIEVTGPQPPTVPMLHSASRSAHGVVHCPMNALPQLPCTPTAEFRDAGVMAMLLERSIGAFCSIWNHAV